MTDEIQALLRKMHSNDEDSRKEAYTEAFRLDATAVEPLCQILADEKAEDHWLMTTLNLLGNIGDKAAVVPIVNLLKRPQSPDTTLARKYAAYTLTSLKDARAVDVLIDLLQEKQWLERGDDDELYLSDEPDHETIAAAIGALASIGEWHGIQATIDRLLVGDTWCDCRMGEWGGERAYQYLVEATKSDDVNRRSSAIGLLGDFGDSRAISVIIPFLDPRQPDAVKGSAVSALNSLKATNAIPLIFPLLASQSNELKLHVAFNVKYMMGLRRSAINYEVNSDTTIQQLLKDVGEKHVIETLLDCRNSQELIVAANGVMFLEAFEPFVTEPELRNRIRAALNNQSAQLEEWVLKVKTGF
jgi:HEAT repeat protein